MASMVTKRGALIVFEGCDRSGKTTQVRWKMLYDKALQQLFPQVWILKLQTQVKKLVETLTASGKPTEMMR